MYSKIFAKKSLNSLKLYVHVHVYVYILCIHFVHILQCLDGFKFYSTELGQVHFSLGLLDHLLGLQAVGPDPLQHVTQAGDHRVLLHTVNVRVPVT